MSASAKTALITGASAGFGKAIAQRLYKDGYKTILAGRRADKLAALARDLGERAYALTLRRPPARIFAKGFFRNRGIDQQCRLSLGFEPRRRCRSQ